MKLNNVNISELCIFKMRLRNEINDQHYDWVPFVTKSANQMAQV